MSTSTMTPSDTSPSMASAEPPLTPMRACAFLIIAAFAVRSASSFALRSLSLVSLRSAAALRRFSASWRSAFMAAVASLFATSMSLCLDLNPARATLSCCVFTLKSLSRRGMAWSRVEVKVSSFTRLIDLVWCFLLGLSSSSIISSSEKSKPERSSSSSPMTSSLSRCRRAAARSAGSAAPSATRHTDNATDSCIMPDGESRNTM
mmetsp:Transcript_126063/g.342255  ORF Transcript_126063/g.342255 Transcript_126063/m.342255 type:complete len:205 (-) Transcript_126063:60-674(-)